MSKMKFNTLREKKEQPTSERETVGNICANPFNRAPNLRACQRATISRIVSIKRYRKPAWLSLTMAAEVFNNHTWNGVEARIKTPQPKSLQANLSGAKRSDLKPAAALPAAEFKKQAAS